MIEKETVQYKSWVLGRNDLDQMVKKYLGFPLDMNLRLYCDKGDELYGLTIMHKRKIDE